MDRIESRNNPRVKNAIDVRMKPSKNAFLVEGFHVVEMASAAFCLDEVFSRDSFSAPNVIVHQCPMSIVDKISSNKSPEGIVGVAHYKDPNPGLKSNRILVLDRIQDPGNMGTLLRTALAFGYKDIFLLPGCCSPFNGKVVAGTQGAIFELSLYFPKNEQEAVSMLHQAGYQVVGSALRNSIALGDFKMTTTKFALVLGNEGRGMTETLISQCDQIVKIEMSGIDSLNVGIAGGILMYNLKNKVE